MRIYVASSWRNELRQQAVVHALCEAGHNVYDFRHPAPGDVGFSWTYVATKNLLTDPVFFRDGVLTHPIARAGFKKDMDALKLAEATVLVLPCGRSAHLELGWAVGHGQRTIVLLDTPLGEPELMYLMCSALCTSITEVVANLDVEDVKCDNCGMWPCPIAVSSTVAACSAMCAYTLRLKESTK